MLRLVLSGNSDEKFREALKPEILPEYQHCMSPKNSKELYLYRRDGSKFYIFYSSYTKHNLVKREFHFSFCKLCCRRYSSLYYLSVQLSACVQSRNGAKTFLNYILKCTVFTYLLPTKAVVMFPVTSVCLRLLNAIT